MDHLLSREKSVRKKSSREEGKPDAVLVKLLFSFERQCLSRNKEGL